MKIKQHTTKAFLKSPNKKGFSPIVVKYIYDGKDYPVATCLKIEPKNWNQNLGFPKNSYPHYSKVKTKIDEISLELMKIAAQIISRGFLPYFDQVRALHQKPKNVFGEPPLIIDDANELEYYREKHKEDYLRQQEQREKKVEEKTKKEFKDFLKDWQDSNASKWAPKSKRDYQTFVNKLLEFSKETKFQLTFENMDDNFYNEYGKWLMYTHGNYNGWFGTCINKMKVFLNWCVEYREAKINKLYKKWEILEEDNDLTYFSVAEINQIWDFQPKNPENKKYLDLCVFGCITGLRYSDIYSDSFKIKDGILVGRDKKTEGHFRVPLELDPRIEVILNKYNFNLRLVSSQVYNRMIKKLIQEMYISKGVKSETITIIRHKFRESFYFPISKDQAIGSHTGRRSFVSNAMSAGHGETAIMEWTGHKTLASFKKYASTSAQAMTERVKAINQQNKK